MKPSLRNYKLIAISGLANSGKTEASKMLEYILNAPKIFKSYFWYKIFKKWKGKWTTTAFAKPLKQTLAILLNRPLEWFENRLNKEYYHIDLDTLSTYYGNHPFLPNKALTENQFSKLIKLEEPITNACLSLRQLMQYYGTSILRKYLGENIWINVTFNNIKSNTIISDCRFKNEFEAIKAAGGTVIYILRPQAVIGNHQSERECVEMYNNNSYDAVIKNDKDLSNLFKNIKNCIKNLHLI